MSTSPDRSTPRREFLGQLTASALVLAGTACAPAVASQAPAPAPASGPKPTVPPEPVHWDDSWFGRLTAKHKAVFDSPAIEDGEALGHATRYITGMRDALAAGPADVQTVVVMRHAAIPMVFNDAIWEKYGVGKMSKVKDFSTNKWATGNPFIAPALRKGAANASATPRPTSPASSPKPYLTWLAANGHVLLGCDLATRGFAYELAEKHKTDGKVVYEELKANLVPGVILQPSGIYAVHRAQEAGCTFLKST